MVLETVEWTIRTIIAIARTIVEVICGWITSVVKTFVEVTKKVCSWLPWPLDQLCEWVTEIIEVVTEVTEWVCEEVISTIIDWVEAIITYVFYIVRWICWVIDWPLRFIDLLFCLLGIHIPRTLHICVKILMDNDGRPATTKNAVDVILARATQLLAQCSIRLCIDSIEFVRKQDLMKDVECGASQFFSSAFPWFEKHSCKGGVLSATKPLTLFFVDSMKDANACTISRTSYIVLTDGANGASVVHEFGHHCDLSHRDDPQNIMFAEASDTKDQLTDWQCCMMRTSEFVSQIFKCRPLPPLGQRLQYIRHGGV
jgi:hypothetical protein